MTESLKKKERINLAHKQKEQKNYKKYRNKENLKKKKKIHMQQLKYARVI